MIWPFRRSAAYPDLEERLMKIERELQAIEESTKRAVRALDNDMDSLWDKVKHWTGRMAKRVAATDPDAPAADTPERPDWNAIIAERRNRGIPNRSR